MENAFLFRLILKVEKKIGENLSLIYFFHQTLKYYQGFVSQPSFLILNKRNYEKTNLKKKKCKM